MKPENETPLIDRVSKAIFSSVKQRNAILFCGAGISMDPPSTLPDWKTFRDETIKAVASQASGLSKILPNLLNRELIAPGKQGLAPEVVASQVRMVVPDYFVSKSNHFSKSEVPHTSYWTSRNVVKHFFPQCTQA
jgi:hypothetical protein